MAKPKKATRAQVGLRVPEDLRERVENAAKVNGRSLNAEILEWLEQSFQTEERFGGSILFYTAETIALVMNLNGQRAAYAETGEPAVVAAHVAGAQLEVDSYRRATEGAPGVRAQHAVRELDVLLAVVPALGVDLASHGALHRLGARS